MEVSTSWKEKELALHFVDIVPDCSNLFIGNGLLRSPAEGLLSGVAWWAGQTVVTRFCVHTLMDSIEHKTGIGNFFALQIPKLRIFRKTSISI